MNIIQKISEADMVAAFLKAELQSPRFSGELKRAMHSAGVAEELINQADTSNARQNALRAKVLGTHRGYGQNAKIFQGFPTDMYWYRAKITRQEVGDLRYVDYSYWNELSDHTHLVKRAVANIRTGKIVFDVPNDQFLAVAERIQSGNFDFEPLILWGQRVNSPLTILEGHLRATAFGLAANKAPSAIQVIVGLAEVPNA